MSLSRDRSKLDDWRRRGARNYEDRVRKEVLAGERDWNSLDGARNPERRERRFRKGFGSEDRAAWVSGQPCIVCGERPSENAHVKSRGAGGTKEDVVPMCRYHHQQQHDIGVQSFSELHHIDLTRAARETHQRWLEHVAETGEE